MLIVVVNFLNGFGNDSFYKIVMFGFGVAFMLCSVCRNF